MARRLRAYCKRTILVFDADGEPRPPSPGVWDVVWRDREVRDVLLAAGRDRNAWDALLGVVDEEHGFALLDLVSAMEIRAKTATF